MYIKILYFIGCLLTLCSDNSVSIYRNRYTKAYFRILNKYIYNKELNEINYLYNSEFDRIKHKKQKIHVMNMNNRFMFCFYNS